MTTDVIRNDALKAWGAGELDDARAMALVGADSVAALHAAAAARRAEVRRLMQEIYAEMEEIESLGDS